MYKNSNFQGSIRNIKKYSKTNFTVIKTLRNNDRLNVEISKLCILIIQNLKKDHIKN